MRASTLAGKHFQDLKNNLKNEEKGKLAILIQDNERLQKQIQELREDKEEKKKNKLIRKKVSDYINEKFLNNLVKKFLENIDENKMNKNVLFDNLRLNILYERLNYNEKMYNQNKMYNEKMYTIMCLRAWAVAKSEKHRAG